MVDIISFYRFSGIFRFLGFQAVGPALRIMQLRIRKDEEDSIGLW